MRWSLLAGCLIAVGCSGNASNPDGACLKTEMLPTSCPTPPVTYSSVQPIFDARCVSVCHNDSTPDPSQPGAKIWGLTDYSHVQDWYREVRDTVANCTMPPPDAGVPVTIEERRAILEFIRCGLPK